MEFLRYIVLSFLLVGCGYVAPSSKERMDRLKTLIQGKNLTRKVFKTQYLNIFGISKDITKCKNRDLSIYIEGDGLSWISPSTISKNPTPINPIGLKLFLKDKKECSLYLSRPCQYIKDKRCHSSFWSDARYSKKIIKSYDEVLDKIKKSYKVKSFTLIGYSGGGAIAALLSAKREDISKLITVCADLDIKEWTTSHHVSPLYRSLNPADFSKRLSFIKQFHFIGGEDKTVGLSNFLSYLKKFKNKSHIKYTIFQNYNHQDYWVQNWQKILYLTR